MTYDHVSPPVDIEARQADALDTATVDEIERLRSAVVHAEAEQRFGVGRGKRSDLIGAAEEAERAFLNSHGFASYNDYRLRIRRSTIISASNVGDTLWMPDAPASEADAFAGDTPAEPDTASDQPRTGSEGNTDHAGPAVDTHPDPQPDDVPTDIAAPDLLTCISLFNSVVTTTTDEMVAVVIEAAEARAADILAQASTRAADVVQRADALRDIARSVADRNTQHLAALYALTTDVERLQRTNTANPDGALTTPSSNQDSTG